MIGIYFNARGVKGDQKQISLKILINFYKLDVVLIHETMCI
jgi:hypothetical protein